MIKKLFVYTMFAIVSFLLAAGGSYLYMNSQDGFELAKASGAQAAVEAEPRRPLPVAVTPDPGSAEDLFRMGEMFRQRQEDLKKREEELEQEKNRLELVGGDIEQGKLQVEGMIAKADEAVLRVEGLLNKMIQQHEKMLDQQNEIDAELKRRTSDRRSIGDNELANLKRQAEIFEAMAPETASQSLTEWINTGQLKAVVRLLHHIETRNVAKILEPMDDRLRTTLLDAYIKSEPPPKTQKR